MFIPEPIVIILIYLTHAFKAFDTLLYHYNSSFKLSISDSNFYVSST